MPQLHSMICYRFVSLEFVAGKTRGTTSDGKTWDFPGMAPVEVEQYADRLENVNLAWSVEHEMHRDTGVVGTASMHRDPDYTRCNCEALAKDAANCARTPERTALIRVWLVGDPDTTPWRSR